MYSMCAGAMSVLQTVLCRTFGSQRVYPKVNWTVPVINVNGGASLHGVACAGTPVPGIRAGTPDA